jgi:hypothetical protein
VQARRRGQGSPNPLQYEREPIQPLILNSEITTGASSRTGLPSDDTSLDHDDDWHRTFGDQKRDTLIPIPHEGSCPIAANNFADTDSDNDLSKDAPSWEYRSASAKPKHAAEDLFSLDPLLSPPESSLQAPQSTVDSTSFGQMNHNPFGSNPFGRNNPFGSKAQVASISPTHSSPPHTSNIFKPFAPSSSFGHITYQGSVYDNNLNFPEYNSTSEVDMFAGNHSQLDYALIFDMNSGPFTRRGSNGLGPSQQRGFQPRSSSAAEDLLGDNDPEPSHLEEAMYDQFDVSMKMEKMGQEVCADKTIHDVNVSDLLAIGEFHSSCIASGDSFRGLSRCPRMFRSWCILQSFDFPCSTYLR